jgi:hypothetical protein
MQTAKSIDLFQPKVEKTAFWETRKYIGKNDQKRPPRFCLTKVYTQAKG